MVDALTGTRRSFDSVERAVAAGHLLAMSTLVLYEWRRGGRPRNQPIRNCSCPRRTRADSAPPRLRRRLTCTASWKRARGRDMDIAIAACVIEHGAHLWTLNPDDFRDMPGLKLYEPA